jgi:ABC-2 type transport system ATP-binding protein
MSERAWISRKSRAEEEESRCESVLEPKEGAAIQTRLITKQFGKEKAVENVTFEVPKGKIFGLIGPSGCGKTTTIRLLTGVYKPTSGEALVLGVQPGCFNQRTRAKIGYMPQNFVLYPDLSVWENLNFITSIYGVGLRRRARLEHLLDFVELSQHKRKRARDISGGMQRRLSLAVTMVHDPELIFLDEPTAAIDPMLRRKFWDRFQELKEEGRTLLVTTQYVGEAAYCDLVGVLIAGRLLTVGTPEELRRKAYGGDVIELTTTERLTPDLRGTLERLPFVREMRIRAEREYWLVVDEASTAIPASVEWAQRENVVVKSVKEYLPPFDDVFVTLVEQEEAKWNERRSS